MACGSTTHLVPPFFSRCSLPPRVVIVLSKAAPQSDSEEAEDVNKSTSEEGAKKTYGPKRKEGTIGGKETNKLKVWVIVGFERFGGNINSTSYGRDDAYIYILYLYFFGCRFTVCTWVSWCTWDLCWWVGWFFQLWFLWDEEFTVGCEFFPPPDATKIVTTQMTWEFYYSRWAPKRSL